MLAPVKVVSPRVMAQQYPEKDRRQRKKFVPSKAKPKQSASKNQDGAHIDITA